MGKYITGTNRTDLILVPFASEKFKNHHGEVEKIYEFNTHIVPRFNELRSLTMADSISTYFEYWDIVNGKDDKTLEDQEISVEDIIDYECADAEGEFTEVNRKKTKSHQQYSRYCVRRYACTAGRKCPYKHNDKEIEFFKNSIERERLLYKIKLCRYGNKCEKFRQNKSYLCPFAHELIEARCLKCKKEGVHWTDECDIIQKEREPFR